MVSTFTRNNEESGLQHKRKKSNMVNMEISNVHTSVSLTKKKRHNADRKIVKTAGTSPSRACPDGHKSGRAQGSDPQLPSGWTLRKIKAQPLADSSLAPASLSRLTSQPCPHGGQKDGPHYCTSGARLQCSTSSFQVCPVSSKQLHHTGKTSTAGRIRFPCSDVANGSSEANFSHAPFPWL